jgi:superoxide reductase
MVIREPGNANRRIEMKRRNIGMTVLSGAAVAAVLPAAAQAAVGREHNVIFTAADPGHWAQLESLHVPVTSVTNGLLTVKTPHPMSAPHFIVSHSVVLAGGKFLDRKTFTWTDQPVSEHTLPAGYSGLVTITSTCNLHDFWVKQITV